MKKIILGTLVLLTIGMGFGFAQTQKKTDTETKSKDYYEGYKQAANDYSKKNQKYNPYYCDSTYRNAKQEYDCIRGYHDSSERNSEVAPRTPKDNSNN